jgi:hypothetical protein
MFCLKSPYIFSPSLNSLKNGIKINWALTVIIYHFFKIQRPRDSMHSLHTRHWLQGHAEELHEVYDVFQNTNVCYFDHLHSP